VADDPSDGYIVGYAFSSTGLPEGYTWTLSGGVWTNITSTAGSPPLWTTSGRQFAMTYDPTDGYVIAVGGTGSTWSFHAGAWSALSPNCYGIKGQALSACPAWGGIGGTPFDRDVLLASDPVDGYVLLLGYTSYSYGSYWTWETWTYVGGRWALVCPHSNLSTSACYSWGTNAPAPRSFSSMASAGSAGVVLFGGYTNMALNDTWTYRKGTWTELSSPVLPKARFSDALEFDPGLNGTVLYGGTSLTPNATFSSDNDTWEFASGAWSNVTDGVAPAPSESSPTLLGAAYDPADSGLILAESIGTGFAAGTYTWMWGPTPPIVALRVTASPLPVDVGALVAFGNPFLGGTYPITFRWSFGDGSVGQGGSPSHIYSSPGNFTVVLIVTDARNDSAIASIVVPVLPAVSARPSAVPAPTDVGLATEFDPGVTGGTSNRTFQWSFGDGAAASAMTPTHAYRSTGNYTVTVWINDTGGGGTRSSFVERVHPALSVTVAASPSAPSLGQIVDFTANASGGTPGYSFAWNFGDGGTGGNLRNISHIFTTNGPFSATVRVTDLIGGTAAAAINLTIALNLTVQGSWSAGAAPLPVTFVSHVTGGVPDYTYNWTFGDGATSEAASPTHIYSATGLFDAVLVVTDADGKRVQASWPLFAAPGGGPLQVALTATSTPIEVGATTNISASVAGGAGGYTMSWAPGNATCLPLGLLAERCGASYTGVFPVRLAVLDGAGHAVEAVTDLDVGIVGVQTPGPGPAHGFPTALLWGAAIGAVVVAIAAIGIARKASDDRRPPTDELYRAYRPPGGPRKPPRAPTPQPSPEAPEEGTESADPLGNLL
jgi:PKD repeat protein